MHFVCHYHHHHHTTTGQNLLIIIYIVVIVCVWLIIILVQLYQLVAPDALSLVALSSAQKTRFLFHIAISTIIFLRINIFH